MSPQARMDATQSFASLSVGSGQWIPFLHRGSTNDCMAPIANNRTAVGAQIVHPAVPQQITVDQSNFHPQKLKNLSTEGCSPSPLSIHIHPTKGLRSDVSQTNPTKDSRNLKEVQSSADRPFPLLQTSYSGSPMMMNPLQQRAEEILRQQAMGRSLSKAIAIQRSPLPPKTSEDAPVSSSMYDWATWRMYHCIVDHREKHPVTRVSDEVAAVMEGCNPMSCTNRPGTSGATTPTLDEEEEEFLDGEVFDIEI